ncbi:MAG: beta-propeller fold lactonase family protein [Acidobacteriota bacterium]|nr:beta-propeller fold lactonase family protein [Acidobacteriota bacterium]
MKFNKSGQLLLVAGASLVASAMLSACATLTVDFVYVTSALASAQNSSGVIDVFEVNSESGFMRQIPSSPFPSGGRNPVAEVVAPDSASLYVVNKDDNSIVQFIIGNDGKLYPNNTVNTPGIFPLAVTRSSSFLFVADLYQPLPICSSASPCAGSIGVFPINSDDSLGTPVGNAVDNTNFWPLTLPSKPSDIIAPTAVATDATGNFLYVTAYDTTASPSVGYIFGFTIGSDGTLTPMNGGIPFAAGQHPSALAVDTSGSFLYATDYDNRAVLSYAIGNSGQLTAVSGSPFATGAGPQAIAVDATGKFAYVANSQDSNITAYSLSSGTLTSLGTFATGLRPVAIGIDPSMNQYLYTANFLGSNVSGFQIQADGTLFNSQNSPYTANPQITAVAAITHNGQKH